MIRKGVAIAGFAAIVGLSGLPSPAHAGETLVDDFSASSTTWTFYNGAEFPGATGSLSLVPGWSGQGLRISFNMTGGGHYVSADKNFSLPAVPSALAFRAKYGPATRVAVRIQDGGGQTCQYALHHPLTDPDPAQWTRLFVQTAFPTSWWGGAADGVLHNGIRKISVMAQPLLSSSGTYYPSAGSVDVDDVVYMDAAPDRLNPAVAPVNLPVVGDLEDNLGVVAHFNSDDAALDAARAAGFHWVRRDLSWSSVEKSTGVYDFSAYDQLTASLQSRGLAPLFILDYGNTLYANASPPTTAAARTAFGNFAEAAASHFAGRGYHYEIWNEPNLSGFWPSGPNAAQYAALVQAVLPRIRNADSTAQVVTAGIAGTDWTYFRDMLAAGVGRVDAIAVHPYRPGIPESALDDFIALRPLVSQAFPTSPPPLADSEWGYTSTWYGAGDSPAARDTQARYACRKILTSWLLGVPFHVYYEYRDSSADPTDQEGNFGLVTSSNQTKPALTAVSTLTRLVRGRHFAGLLPQSCPGLNAARFDGPTDMLLVVWREEGAAGTAPEVRFTQAPAAVADFLGNPVGWTNMGGGEVSVPVGNAPTYLTFPAIAILGQDVSHPYDLHFWPNPADKQLRFAWEGTPAAEGIQVQLYNAAGQAVAEAASGASSQTLDMDVHSLASGVYIFHAVVTVGEAKVHRQGRVAVLHGRH
jgi:hypothetical protein